MGTIQKRIFELPFSKAPKNISYFTTLCELHYFGKLMHLALCFRYRTRTGWRAHEAYVHTKQLNFKCDEPGCDKAYLCDNDLIVHKRKHSGELPFTCSYCGNRYISAHSLAQHEKAAHLQTEVSCIIIFFRFSGHSLKYQK